MTETVEDRIHEMLEHTVVGRRGYPIKKIDLLTTWDGYDVYNFYLDVDDDAFIQIGMPWFYLVKGDEITVTDLDQALDIIEKVYDETHEQDDDQEEWEDEEEQESVPEPVPCMMSCAGPRI